MPSCGGRTITGWLLLRWGSEMRMGSKMCSEERASCKSVNATFANIWDSPEDRLWPLGFHETGSSSSLKLCGTGVQQLEKHL